MCITENTYLDKDVVNTYPILVYIVPMFVIDIQLYNFHFTNVTTY